MLATILERAPDVPGWEFYPYRPAESVAMAHQTVQARIGRTFADVQVQVTRGRCNFVDLVYTSPDFQSDDDQPSNYAAMVLTETLLGEEAMDRWVGVIEPQPAPKEGVLGLFSRNRSRPGGLPLDRLKPTFDALVQSIRDQLPRQPLHAVDLKADDQTWSSFQLEADEADDYPGRNDMFVGVTPSPDLSRATFDPRPFSSERFSRFGESFCYLKIDGTGGLDPAFYGDRGDIEDALDKILIAAKLGRTIGGGTGRRYSYIELALADVERAADLIRKLLRAGNIPRRTWLLFHEAEFRDEWIGIYDDTDPPPIQ
jgi:hypothetical protein